MKYKVELAEFRTIEVDAETQDEASDIVAMMDDEDILEKAENDGSMIIWDITEV